jgi:hypothetical protein
MPKASPQELKYLLSNPATTLGEPRLYRLVSIEDRRYEAYDGRALSGRTPILFVHGAQYSEPEDVLRDLVCPCLKTVSEVDKVDVERLDILFLMWNSSFVCKRSNARLYSILKAKGATRAALATFDRWKSFFADVETRGHEAAEYLFPLVAPLFSNAPGRPLVITHSLGGLVWAETVTKMTSHAVLPKTLGHWWNLQPAIAHDAFHATGIYASLPQLYVDHGTMIELWFSRLDCVLSSVYLAAKRRWAMGVTGVKHALVRNIDLTWSVLEAHGTVSWSRHHEGFWHRISPVVAERFRQFCLLER